MVAKTGSYLPALVGAQATPEGVGPRKGAEDLARPRRPTFEAGWTEVTERPLGF